MKRADVVMVHQDVHGLVATWRNVVFVLVHDQLTVELLAASVKANRSIAPRYPQGVASLSSASMGIKFPSAAERVAASEAIAAVRDSVRCAAQHISGDGFWASAARSIVTAIEMVRPDDRPRRTFTRLSEATFWMSQRMGEDQAWAREVEAILRGLGESATEHAALSQPPAPE